jgi:SAM-dependent methyltransferase
MMSGLREPFTYFECANCGCLQLLDVPKNLGRFYGNNYYSFDATQFSSSAWRSFGRKLLTAGEVFRIPGLRAACRRRRGRSPHLESLAYLRPKPGMAILDVGCGDGNVLYLLRELGFRAEGVDKFIPRHITDQYGIRVHSVDLSEIQGKWDLIMFHHSLEHIPEHHKVLGLVRKRLNPEGRCLIRMPVAEEAWRIYGINWVQLDAPRHLILHTIRSFRILAEQSGFLVEQCYCDSDEFQFWGSELYKRDIPLREGGPHLFTANQLYAFQKNATILNQHHIGDQGVFVLRQAGENTADSRREVCCH